MKSNASRAYWSIAYWILLIGWILGAGLFMARFRGGFFTNYLADLTFPPWYYIYLRGHSSKTGDIPSLILFGKWFGQSPERAAISIFIVGVVSELKTLYWPNGFISGTFDSLDILAYAIGLLVCYYFDKLPLARANT